MKSLRSMLITYLSLMTISSCNSSPKTPAFDPEDTLTISGSILQPDGSPLADRQLQLKNLREFAYIDYTEVGYKAVSYFLLLPWAFPFFPFYDPFNAPDLPEPEFVPANFFTSKVKTDAMGQFSFAIKAKNFVRDADQGINIQLVNEDDGSRKFIHYSFVIKNKDTDLGEARLCDVNLTVTETAGQLAASWNGNDQEISEYVLKVALEKDKSLIWATSPDVSATSAAIPKAALGSESLLMALQIYTKKQDDHMVSCLSPAKTVTIQNPIESVAQQAVAISEGIPYKISSLTNGQLNDNVYFEAFETKTLTLDLGSVKTFNQVALYNLLLRDSHASLQLAISDDNTNWRSLGSFEESRFNLIELTQSISARFLKLEFSSNLIDLKEIALLE